MAGLLPGQPGTTAKGGPGGSRGKASQYQKWGANTKWAHYSRIITGYRQVKTFKPGTAREGGTTKKVPVYGPGGWVRVGSSRWKAMHADPQHVPVPDKFHTGHWNPESPQYQSLLEKQKLAQGSTQVGSDPGRGGEQAAQAHPTKNNGGIQTTPGTNPKNPPKTPPKGPKLPPIGSTKVGQMMPASMAAAMAGLQYDAQIHDVGAQIAEGGAQHNQNMADIANWFAKLGTMNDQGQVANDQAVQSAAGADDRSTQAALAAIGGGANKFAGAVGAQGAQASAMARMLGTIQDQYHSNEGVALGQAQSGDLAAQNALDSQASTALQQQLTDLLGQKGQARVANMQSILAANNSLAQTRFGDRISKLQAIMGAKQLGMNLALNKAQLAQTSGAGKGPNATNPNTWGGMTPAARYDAITKGITGPNNTKLLEPIAIQRLRAMIPGFGGPGALQLLHTFYE